MHAFSILTRLMALVLLVGLAQPAMAQGQFSPAITVNDRVITPYEIDQRRRLLELFRTPGDLPTLAREQLIEDRLKQGELVRAGIQLTDESLLSAMEEFAARANLSLEQFTALLAQNGVEQATLRDFVEIGVTWRDYIRSRYGPRTAVSDADIDRALGQNNNSTTQIEVLLSEIIIPAPPPQAAQALATAQRIAQTTSTATFEAEARRVSALPSRANGGRLGWLPVSNYPPQLRSVILDLGVGDVTAPIQIPNGVALFQMRGVREVAQASAPPSSIEYAAFYLPATGADAGVTAAQNLANRVDTCDDLYGAARGLPENVLERDDLPPAAIPQDVALELARLDPGEVSYNLTRSNGATRVFLMLCKRNGTTGGDVDRDSIENQLRSQRLAGFADALLEDLRAAAIIATP